VKILALDTATPHASVALVTDGATSERSCQVTTHSEGLLLMIDQVLRESNSAIEALDAIVCGQGPGSYTGLRIGVATAKGLCLASGKPLVLLSTMTALASAVGPIVSDERWVMVVLDARRGEVFVGLYRNGVSVGDELVCEPGKVGQHLPAEPAMLVGDGAARYHAQLLSQLPAAELAPAELHAVQARYLAQVATDDVSRGRFAELRAAVPRYLRAPDIRPPRVVS